MDTLTGTFTLQNMYVHGVLHVVCTRTCTQCNYPEYTRVPVHVSRTGTYIHMCTGTRYTCVRAVDAHATGIVQYTCTGTGKREREYTDM